MIDPNTSLNGHSTARPQAPSCRRDAPRRHQVRRKRRTVFGVDAEHVGKILGPPIVDHAAANEADQGHRNDVQASMAKLFASEMAERVTSEGIQIHGGAAYMTDLPLERMMRDAKITQIYEGTSEVQRIVISRSILK